MENAPSDRSSAVSSQHSHRSPPKTRSRISAACIRCQKRKIRCDAALPSCTACEKAGANCVGGGTSREIPRSYVSDLEARIQWLESTIRKNLPDVDLSQRPTDPINRLASRRRPEFGNDGLGDSPRDGDALREITDQVGLVSLNTGADLRYLGPSSGLFFTKFVLTGLGRRLRAAEPSPPDSDNALTSVPVGLLVAQPSDLPSDQKHAKWLSAAYFETVHLQFPFLHEPTHLDLIQKMYDGEEVSPISEFQVFMVLSIGATILSRRAKVQLSAEGYCASAMGRLSSVFQKVSLMEIQCILLLQMYTIHNSSSGLSLWTLHHHCLASVIELGLHRNVPGNVFTLFEQEMRTRAFWCTYTVDRILSTLMGRPVGLMDEHCDMRLPLDVNDEDLTSAQCKPRQPTEPLTQMSTAIHLFKLARFNAEIKCVLYCVDRAYPPYTVPLVTDVARWKDDMLSRLRQWKEDIPRHPEGSGRCCTNVLCEIKYHELVMLVLRPSPLFQHPSRLSIRECFSSAMNCSMLYHKLYTKSTMQYSWISVHSLFLCVITMFYCVWTPDGTADEVNFDTLVRALRCTSDILSATGEYWPEAKRSRDVLDRILTTTMQRVTRRSDSDLTNREAAATHTSIDISPASGSNQPADGDAFEGGPAWHPFPGFQFTEENVASGIFTPFYADQADSFMTADMASYFMGSEANASASTSTGPEADLGEGYPNIDENMLNFFEP